MNDDLISREALKKAIDELFDNGGYDSGLVINTIDNAPTVEPDVNCLLCDYRKFSQVFIDNIIKVMTDYNIETVEDLMKELNHINELLGGGQ